MALFHDLGSHVLRVPRLELLFEHRDSVLRTRIDELHENMRLILNMFTASLLVKYKVVVEQTRICQIVLTVSVKSSTISTELGLKHPSLRKTNLKREFGMPLTKSF